MQADFLQRGFYVSTVNCSEWSYHDDAELKGGAALKGVDQQFSRHYEELTFLATDTKVKGNMTGLVKLINHTPADDVVFPGNGLVSPKRFYEFYKALLEADNFDYSRKYYSTAPEDLAPFLDKLVTQVFNGEDLGRFRSGDVFKVVRAEAERFTTVKLDDLAEFSFNRTKHTLKKLSVMLVVTGVAQYDHNVDDGPEPGYSEAQPILTRTKRGRR
ncbi:hypothetical protein HYU12_02285 [Candidatus Woesearchaeota archaeon]|nr:hypothetical protein [Candidatus Woesearchaeota archaeon]